ncbi:MAG TPA: bifunctional riboflavin kinase/FAD synthetase [Burkholderiaceae bacterium]|nr:bifunctional riboflavin kinase/FAD synthetase [Burkholderiaceae bacterium]
MKPAYPIYRTLPRHDSARPSAVTIGNFDGVHAGHQAILERLGRAAAERDLAPTVMTFEPHPRAWFAQLADRPELIPARISSQRDKLKSLLHHGAEQIVLMRFNHAVANMSATAFIEKWLVRGLATRWLLVGTDFRYGHRRSGDIDLLRQAGRHHGFEVQTIEDVVDDEGQRISSSTLRTALAVGEQDRVRALLGHSFRVSGHVIHGRKLGRDIGFPTINLRVPEHFAARSAVYVVKVHGLAPEPLKAVASLGIRPTVQHDGELILEAHILDAQPNAYGKLACVEFLAYLRDEARFPDLPTMIAAIKTDIQRTHDYFATHGL